MSATKTWNVRVAVVDLIEAPDSAAAIKSLRAKLTAAGFEWYEGDADAFESEPLP